MLKQRYRKVGIVIFPQAQVLDITGPHEVFSLTQGFLKDELAHFSYEVCLIAPSNQAVKMSSGLKIIPDCTYEQLEFDTLIVPGSEMIETALEDIGLLDWISKAVNHSRRVVSICTGAFFLAELGLLDGKRVTTHWAYSALLQKNYPQLHVDADAIYVKQDNIYTSAGITAGIDLSLSLVEEDVGKSMALRVARKLVLFYKRPGGQNQFSELLHSQSSESLESLIEWIMNNLAKDLSVGSLAERMNMSSRNFTRLFKRELAETPAKFIEKLRLNHARILLEGNSYTLNEIARKSGFRSEEQMRRTFQRILGITPQDYKLRFS